MDAGRGWGRSCLEVLGIGATSISREWGWREAAESIFLGCSETDQISETKERELTENSEVTDYQEDRNVTTEIQERIIARGKLNVDPGPGYV